MNLIKLNETCHERIEKTLHYYLQDNFSEAPNLQRAMAYSVFNGGKRLRPLLVYATGRAFDAAWENLDAPACAIELIHAYSLVHDDLPAMDNADLRRGKPSCHKAFNEALAILAGDALQTMAFDILASHPCSITDQQRLAMIKLLSTASGLSGMAAGQALDLAGTADLTEMYQLKTGKLLKASIMLGVAASGINCQQTLLALDNYADNMSLAFQIQDDLLDFSAVEITGKPVNLDMDNQKKTFPILYGIEETKNKVARLFEDALAAIKPLGENGKILEEVVGLIRGRGF